MKKNRTKVKKRTGGGVFNTDIFIKRLLAVELFLAATFTWSFSVYQHSPLISTYSSLSSGVFLETFIYPKMLLLFLFLFLNLAALLVLLGKREVAMRDSAFIFFAAILFCGVFSQFFADYKNVVMAGMRDLREPVLVFVTYLVTFLLASLQEWERRDFRFLAYSLGAALLVNLFFGLSFFFDQDIANNPLVSFLITKKTSGVVHQTDLPELYGLLGNKNYVSGFGAVLSLFFLVSFLFSEETKERFINAGFFVCSAAMVSIATSSGGFLVFYAACAIIALLMLFSGQLRGRLKYLAAGLLLFFLVTSVLGMIDPRVNENRGIEDNVFSVSEREKVDESLKEYYSSFGLTVEGIKTLGGGRGIFWEGTLELISEKPLTGYGANTLAYYFPQKELFLVNGKQGITAKAHNFYLAMAFEYGLPLLLLFLAMNMTFFARTLKRMFRPGIYPREMYLLLTVSAAVLAFLGQGIPNDSHITNTFFYWVFLGIGFSLQKSVDAGTDSSERH